MYIYISSHFFKNQPNEICCYLSKKVSKGRFFGPDKLQNCTSKGKGTEKKKEWGGRKEQKRKKTVVVLSLLVFIMATLKTAGHKRSVWW